jgi:hypothetical protein
MGYRLKVSRDVDEDGGSFGTDVSYILNLPHGFRFDDDLVHVRGFDSMKELRDAARSDVIACSCKDCVAGLARVSGGLGDA